VFLPIQLLLWIAAELKAVVSTPEKDQNRWLNTTLMFSSPSYLKVITTDTPLAAAGKGKSKGSKGDRGSKGNKGSKDGKGTALEQSDQDGGTEQDQLEQINQDRHSKGVFFKATLETMGPPIAAADQFVNLNRQQKDYLDLYIERAVQECRGPLKAKQLASFLNPRLACLLGVTIFRIDDLEICKDSTHNADVGRGQGADVDALQKLFDDPDVQAILKTSSDASKLVLRTRAEELFMEWLENRLLEGPPVFRGRGGGSSSTARSSAPHRPPEPSWPPSWSTHPTTRTDWSTDDRSSSWQDEWHNRTSYSWWNSAAWRSSSSSARRGGWN
jgi:hypothetical protein